MRAKDILGLGLVVSLGALCVLAAPSQPPRTWAFVEDTASSSRLGLRATDERSGSWSIEPVASATGARALVNRPGQGGAPAGAFVSLRDAPRDVRVATTCMASRAGTPSACGIVARWVDAANHVVGRIDAERGVAELAIVAGGAERLLASRSVPVPAEGWHKVALVLRGDSLSLEHAGKVVAQVLNPSLPNAGPAGVWAPSAALAAFDSLAVEPAVPVAHSTEFLPFLLL